MDGAAAAMSEHNKEEEHRRDIDGGSYDWEPMVMQSGGRLGKGAMRVINRVAMIAAESDGVEKHVFVRRTQEALNESGGLGLHLAEGSGRRSSAALGRGRGFCSRAWQSALSRRAGCASRHLCTTRCCT